MFKALIKKQYKKYEMTCRIVRECCLKAHLYFQLHNIFFFKKVKTKKQLRQGQFLKREQHKQERK